MSCDIRLLIFSLAQSFKVLNDVVTFHIVSISLLSPGVNVGVSVLIIAVDVVAELIVLGLLLVVGLGVVGGGRVIGGLEGVRGRVDSVVDGVVRDNRGGVDSVVDTVVRDNRDWVGNQRSCMNSVVGDYRGGMDSMMNTMVSHGMWSQGNSWTQMRGVVSGGDDNTSVADGGVVADITTDPGHEGPQCYCCYLNVSYIGDHSESVALHTFILVCPTVD